MSREMMEAADWRDYMLILSIRDKTKWPMMRIYGTERERMSNKSQTDDGDKGTTQFKSPELCEAILDRTERVEWRKSHHILLQSS